MASAIAWADLRARLTAAAFMSGGVAVSIAYPNTNFKRPAPGLPWLRADVASGAALPIDVGANIWSDEGESIVDIFVPTGSGLDASIALIDGLKAMFRGPPFDTVIYVRVAADSGGSGDDDGLYWITSVRANWRLETIITRTP